MRKSTQRAAVKSIIGMSLLRATRADQTVEANWIKLDHRKMGDHRSILTDIFFVRSIRHLLCSCT
jgi:hypothetical protein